MSYLFFHYMAKLLSLGNQRSLELSDLYPLHSGDNPAKLKRRFEEEWARQLKKPEPSLLRTVVHVIGYRVYLLALLEFVTRALWIVSPLLLERMVIWVADHSRAESEGFIIAGFMFLVPFCSALGNSHRFHLSVRAWQHVRCGWVCMSVHGGL